MKQGIIIDGVARPCTCAPVPKLKPAKHSKIGVDGKLYVACSECERGGNGAAKDKCSCGWQVKRGGKRGCYIGQLMAGLRAKQAKGGAL